MSNVEKSELRKANDNPWYCLATLHGEHPEADITAWDTGLAAKNRISWNRWMAGVLSSELRDDLVKRGFPAAELAPLTEMEKIEYRRDFAARAGRSQDFPPDPTESVDFVQTHLDKAVVFAGFLFVRDARFRSATFSGDADFGSATFSGRADFGSATFSDRANFESARFRGDTYFPLATFSGDAEFRSARFSGDAHFRLATFRGIAHFGSARFRGYAGFVSATFGGSVGFVSARFRGYAGFGWAKFCGDTNFGWTTFRNYAGFDSATFFREVDFKNAKFGYRTIFAEAEFQVEVPDFRGAEMHEATEWHGASWPSPNADEAQAQVYAYERLKQEMERLKKHEDEQAFFRRELRARRGLAARPAAWLLNYIYEAASDYGQSAARPILGLLVLFVIGCTEFTREFVAHGWSTALSTIAQAARFSIAHMLPFLSIAREFSADFDITQMSATSQVVAGLQSVLGTALLFLIGLALRNRFRMR